MFSVIIGALLKIILDPIFIYALNLGVRGAAVATVISQAASAAWVFFHLISRKSEIRIKPANMRLRITVIGSIYSLGISPFIMMSTESLVNMVFNSGLQAYGGDVYVGSMTCLLYTSRCV